MARKLLGAAETISNWTSLGGASAGALRFLGVGVDEPQLMGTSGLAFRLAVGAGPAGIGGGQSELAIDRRRALALFAGLGVSWEWLSVAPDEREYARRREQLVGRIRRSIDRGRPAVAYGLHLPEYGLIKGYDDREQIFFVSTTVSPQYGPALPWAQWPAPGLPGRLDVLLPGERRRVDLIAAERAALRFAVEYARQGEPALGPEPAQGLAAYDRWLEGYAAPERLDRFGNARAVQALLSARRDAAAYLRFVATHAPAGAVAALTEAAASYAAEALALSRLASLFPYPSGGDVSSAGALEAGAAALRQALEHERVAVGLLDRALAAM
jgi:hypothetical protein